jgi:hypothetical protein
MKNIIALSHSSSEKQMKLKIHFPIIVVLVGLAFSACNLPAGNTPIPVIIPPTNTAPIPAVVPPTDAAPIPTLSTKVKPPAETKAPTPQINNPAPRTNTPTPTEVITDNFSPDAANDVPPDDVLEEVSFYAGGGGPECAGNYPQPTISSDPSDQEQMILVRFITCGWKNGQSLKGTVTAPDGRVMRGSLTIFQGGNAYGAELTFRAKLSDPAGLYTFRLTSKEANLETNAYFRQPRGPHLYKLDNEHILLSGFKPRENINLLYYKRVSDKERFGGLSTYQTDESGQLEVEVSVGQKKDEFIDSITHTFVAIGEKSGEVHLLHNTPAGSTYTLLEQSVTGQPLSAVAGTAEKYTLHCSSPQIASSHYQKGNKINVGKDTQEYANPRTDARAIGNLRAGSQLSLGDSPFCVNGQVWWRASSGYVAEATLVQNEKVSQPVCSGPKSRLSVGAHARVAFTDGTDMRIRAKPGFKQTILNTVPEGTLFTILDGPQCMDGSAWWYIRTDGGLKGWMVESQNGVYLLEPVQ